MKICIIGNGSSNFLYNKNIEKFDLTICCNVPQHGFKWDVISIIDPQPVRIIDQKKLNLGKIWCPPDTKRTATSKKLLGDWQPVYNRKPWYNSGLISIDYVCQNYKNLEEIHIWGFNSLYQDNFHSQMDNLVPRKRTKNLNKYWIPKWEEVIGKYSNIIFYIHIPSTENLKKEYRRFPNFRSYYHSVPNSDKEN